MKPLKVKDPKVKQPPFPLRSLPANTLHIGPSGSGKSVALIRTLIDSDKFGGCFDAYHVFSPNFLVDLQYTVLGKYKFLYLVNFAGETSVGYLLRLSGVFRGSHIMGRLLST